MDIFFSKSNPLNAILRDDDKRTLYRIDTPFSLFNKVTTVTRSGGRGRVGDCQVMARIEWHRFSKTRFEFDGHPMVAKVFLKRRKGGREHIFQGADGRSYKWKSGSHAPSLRLNDGSKTIIAEYHGRSLGFFGFRGHKPYLRIHPQGMHMRDMIVATFIFVEKKRTDRKKDADAVAAASTI